MVTAAVLAAVLCGILAFMSLKLYTEIMKEKVISSRQTTEHSIGHNPPPTFTKPTAPPSPPIKRMPLRDAIILAQKLMQRRGTNAT